MNEEKEVLVVDDLKKPSEDDLKEILEEMKKRVATETYVGPGPTVRELNLKAKNRAKNKAARKIRRNQRKRK